MMSNDNKEEIIDLNDIRSSDSKSFLTKKDERNVVSPEFFEIDEVDIKCFVDDLEYS